MFIGQQSDTISHHINNLMQNFIIAAIILLTLKRKQ